MNHQPIFIVDDDEDDRNLLFAAFEKLGTASLIRFFNSGFDLVEFLATLGPQNAPALIVLDYNMPLLNGGQTLRQIRKQGVHRSVPVVVYSTGFTPGIRTELEELNVLACMQKGSEFTKLIQQAQYFTELVADEHHAVMSSY